MGNIESCEECGFFHLNFDRKMQCLVRRRERLRSSRPSRKMKTEGEKVWYEKDPTRPLGQDLIFHGCPYCKKKMSQSAAEKCVYTHMLAYYRYKTIRMMRDDPEYWFAKWGSVLPDDPLTDSGVRFDKFNEWYWEDQRMQELAAKVDTNGYDLGVAQAVWSDFQKEWKAERVGDFHTYRQTFRRFLKEIRVKKPGDFVYAKNAGSFRSSWYKATVKAIDTGKLRVVYDDWNGPMYNMYKEEWIMLDREGRSWLKAYSDEDPNDPISQPVVAQAPAPKRRWKEKERIDVQDHLGKWYEAVICEVRNTQVFVHYEGWSARWNEWIECDSKRIEPLYTHTLPPTTIEMKYEEAGMEMEDIEFPFEPSVPEAPEPAFESTLRRHVVADLAEFVEKNNVHCEDCKEPMTTQTFHLTRCFHMICKFCNHRRGERCFCGHPFATPMAMPADFKDALPQIGTIAKWECVVCTEPMTTRTFHLTSCFHKVCNICLTELTKRRDPRCPVCREKINS